MSSREFEGWQQYKSRDLDLRYSIQEMKSVREHQDDLREGESARVEARKNKVFERAVVTLNFVRQEREHMSQHHCLPHSCAERHSHAVSREWSFSSIWMARCFEHKRRTDCSIAHHDRGLRISTPRPSDSRVVPDSSYRPSIVRYSAADCCLMCPRSCVGALFLSTSLRVHQNRARDRYTRGLHTPQHSPLLDRFPSMRSDVARTLRNFESRTIRQTKEMSNIDMISIIVAS
ncbi:hypothetical protein GOBAR_DD15720 [Gossypium barbadense]|nr:hypothetical protein GOBAR_DD15720 [Gossypium barbadense]